MVRVFAALLLLLFVQCPPRAHAAPHSGGFACSAPSKCAWIDEPRETGVNYCCMSEASFNGYAPETCLKWVCNDLDDGGSSAETGQAPGLSKRLKCDIGPRNASSLEYEHVAPGSMASVGQIAALLNNTVLIFGGDSTAKQRYCALSCAMGRFGFTSRRYDISVGRTGGLRHAGEPVYRIFLGWSLPFLSPSQSLSPNAHLDGYHSWRHAANVARQVLGVKGIIAAVNCRGLHYHIWAACQKLGQDLCWGTPETYRRLVSKVVADIDRLNHIPGSAGFLVETVPQHFPTPDGSGSYDSMILASPDAITDLQCASSKYNDSYPSWQVAMEREIARDLGSIVLPLFGPKVIRPDIHIPPRDCTHSHFGFGTFDAELLGLVHSLKCRRNPGGVHRSKPLFADGALE